MIIIRETTTFKIPPKLKPFTQISGDLKNFKNWMVEEKQEYFM